MFIRTAGNPLSALPAVRTAVRRIEPDAVFHGARTLSDMAAESAAATRLASRLLGGFAAIALVLAAIGVYGVMSYRVRRRSRELGTRLALGASPANLTWLVLRQASLIALVGLGGRYLRHADPRAGALVAAVRRAPVGPRGAGVGRRAARAGNAGGQLSAGSPRGACGPCFDPGVGIGITGAVE